MPGSYDFIYDLLENIESQGFDYYFVLLDKDHKGKNDKIVIYTTFNEDEFSEIIKAIKNENKEKKVRKKKGSSTDI